MKLKFIEMKFIHFSEYATWKIQILLKMKKRTQKYLLLRVSETYTYTNADLKISLYVCAHIKTIP